MAENRAVASEAVAVERAKALTGLDQLSSEIVVRRVTVSNNTLPFLWKEVVNKPAWEVRFLHSVLKLKSAVPNFRDRYPREFAVVLLQESGALVTVGSTFPDQDSDMRPSPSAQSAEQQLQNEEETYSAFPAGDPKIPFLDALDIVLAKGSGSPFTAKAIEGVYVMESRMGSPPRPVWAITLRGLPPFSAHGPHADSVPVWQRNHMRNVVNAMTGEMLFATNSPQPQ